MFDLDLLFQKSELIPAVVQDVDSREVLMVGFTNREAVERTLETKTAWFWSRSRKKLWNKGEASGNFLHIKEILIDCDTDTLLYLCVPDGPVCHTGARSCFFNKIPISSMERDIRRGYVVDSTLEKLYQVILNRKTHPQEGSYTCYLFDNGLDKILKKVGEECAETIIAAKNDVSADTVGEISDLIYHLMVMMAEKGIPLEAVLAELNRRAQKIGNLKQIKQVDRES